MADKHFWDLIDNTPAMQTSQLHMIPLAKASVKVSDVLADAIPIAVPGLATTPPFTTKNTIKSDLPNRQRIKTNRDQDVVRVDRL